MNRSTTCALVAATALLLLGGGRVRADMVDFSYSWSISPQSVYPSGTGTVSFAPTTASNWSVELNGAAGVTPASYVTTDSTAGGAVPPDVFNTAFSLTLHLTDTA